MSKKDSCLLFLRLYSVVYRQVNHQEVFVNTSKQFYTVLLSVSHMDPPDSTHPIFHFTTQIPLSSSIHPLHILPHPPGALLFLSPGIFFIPTSPCSLSLTSSSPCCLFSCLLHSSMWPLDPRVVCRGLNELLPSNPYRVFSVK